MKTYITILFMSFSLLGISQKSMLNIFSEAGDNFTVYANGVKANPQPMPTVVVPELSAGRVHVRIAFVKKGVPELNSQINIPADGQVHSLSYKIVKSAKGPYNLVFIVDQTSGGTTASSSKDSKAKAPEKESTKNKEKEKEKEKENKNERIADNNSNTPASGNLSISIAANDEKMEMSMSVNDNTKKQDKTVNPKNESAGEGSANLTLNMNVSGSPQTSGTVNQSATTNNNSSYSQNSSVTTTTTTTTTTSNNNQPVDNQQTTSAPTYSYSSSTCTPMEAADFEEALEAADDPINEDAKMKVAKGVFDDACLNTSQIYRVAEIFINEDRRLEFTKFAYSRTSEKSKYFRLNKLFISEARITELTNYVNQNK